MRFVTTTEKLWTVEYQWKDGGYNRTDSFFILAANIQSALGKARQLLKGKDRPKTTLVRAEFEGTIDAF